MSYASQTCGDAEKVRYRTHYHWFYWLGGILLTGAPALAFAFGPFGSWMSLAVLFVTLIGLPFGLVILVRALASEIVVTSDRFIKKSGLISFDSEDISLDKVEEVNLDQSVLGRLFDYGTLEVHGSGRGVIRVEMIQSPERLRREIEDAREALP